MTRVLAGLSACLILAALLALSAGMPADDCYRLGKPVPAGQPCRAGGAR